MSFDLRPRYSDRFFLVYWYLSFFVRPGVYFDDGCVLVADMYPCLGGGVLKIRSGFRPVVDAPVQSTESVSESLGRRALPPPPREGPAGCPPASSPPFGAPVCRRLTDDRRVVSTHNPGAPRLEVCAMGSAACGGCSICQSSRNRESRRISDSFQSVVFHFLVAFMLMAEC